jgi:hypothetical protein
MIAETATRRLSKSSDRLRKRRVSALLKHTHSAARGSDALVAVDRQLQLPRRLLHELARHDGAWYGRRLEDQ